MLEELCESRRDYTVNMQPSASNERDELIVGNRSGEGQIAAGTLLAVRPCGCVEMCEVGATIWDRLGEAIRPAGTAA